MCAIWASLPGHSSPLKSVSVALGVGEQRRGSGFRRGSTRAQRPPTSTPARGDGARRSGWSLRTHRTPSKRREASSAPRLTRTPRKRPASWAQRELKSPWCTWLLHNCFRSQPTLCVFALCDLAISANNRAVVSARPQWNYRLNFWIRLEQLKVN